MEGLKGPRSTPKYRPPAPEATISLTLAQQVVLLMGAGQLEREIDEKIYELYDLTDEEISTIEKTQY